MADSLMIISTGSTVNDIRNSTVRRRAVDGDESVSILLDATPEDSNYSAASDYSSLFNSFCPNAYLSDLD
jgi:hypothetical protein